MIKEKTLLILGAGASYPYGFPTGEGLKYNITKDFAYNYSTLMYNNKNNALRIRGDEFGKRRTRENIEKQTSKFAKSPIPSIDLYISRFPEFADLGKRAILFNILEAERNSLMFNNVPDAKVKYDWYKYLFLAMTEGIKVSEDINRIKDNQVKILTFNYDRSFEHYLYEAIKRSFNHITGEVNQIIVDHFAPIHVFGSPPLNGDSPEDYIAYKEELESNKLNKFSDSIKTIYEQSSTKDYVETIQWADRIFFLGFGFAKENLDVIGIPKYIKPEQKIYATAIGLSKHVMRNTIKSFLIDFREKTEVNYVGRDEFIDVRFFIKPEMDSVQLLDEYL